MDYIFIWFLSLITCAGIAYFYYIKKIKEKSFEIDLIRKKATEEAENIIQDAKIKASQATEEAENEINNIHKSIESYQTEYQKYLKLQYDLAAANQLLNTTNNLIENANNKYSHDRQLALNKLAPIKRRLKSAKKILQSYFTEANISYNHKILEQCISEIISLYPTIELPLKSLEYQDLKSQLKENKREIKKIFDEYESRYKLKSNRSIYKLMVIALQAEIQNLIYNLKYSNLEKSLLSVTEICHKYMAIAADGNQSINPTWLKFIGEIEELFKRTIGIEYEYYVRRMQIKEEQIALKERMRQEAEERRFLLEQEKKVIKEEEKYQNEIQLISERLTKEIEEGQIYLLKQRISELEHLLKDVRERKEDILNLQNGKAGFVYIISNLGSFGNDVFKIGMTRRLDPQDRIDELSNASVPFRFDVHSFIFSEDAVSLEYKLHKRLDNQRVNKVTTRKEFFRCSINDLEKLVYDIQPAASFIKTMLAEQYRITLEIEKDTSKLTNP